MDVQYLRSRRCAAVGCSSVSSENKLFRFPKEPVRIAQWAAVSRNPRLMDGTQKSGYLCARHFDSRQFRDHHRVTLLRGATPSISIPLPSPDMPPEIANSPSSVHGDRSSDVSVCTISLEPDFSRQMTSTPLYGQSCSTTPMCPDLYEVDAACPSVMDVDDRLSMEESRKPSCSTKLLYPDPPEVMGNTTSPSIVEDALPNAEDVLSANSSVNSDRNQSLLRKKQPSILAQINCTRKKQLTPRKKILLSSYEKNLRSLRCLRKKYKAAKITINELTDATSDPAKAVEVLSNSMSLAAAQFVASQIRCGKRSPKGRRWTEGDKLLALAMYKRSPKSYTLLQSIFALPSKRTLIKIVNTVPFDVGIDNRVFTSLTLSVNGMDERDRVCCLMFDEMSLRLHLQYNVKTDRVMGFEDLGGMGRSRKVANQALVFMVQGLRRKWKQPVAYYVSHGGVSSKGLVTILREVLDACESSGLNVVATICDMGPKSVCALKMLGSTTYRPRFINNGKSIHTLFDPPHLVKCFRNMLFRHDVNVGVKLGGVVVDGKATWNHIIKAYEVDGMQEHYRHLQKLTADHLTPTGYLSMRVSLDTQVLSNAMAATICGFITSGDLPAAALHTAHYAGHINKLFDSFNGRSVEASDAAGLKCQLRVEREMLHLQFWKDSIAEIEKWQFFRKGSGSGGSSVLKIPSQGGWLGTLRAALNLWGTLKDLGFTSLETRSLNQDPVEHLFGCIRHQCGCNSNPTVPQFQSALKASIINGMAFKDITGSNCEEDTDPAKLLSNLREFLIAPTPNEVVSEDAHQQQCNNAVIHLPSTT